MHPNHSDPRGGNGGKRLRFSRQVRGVKSVEEKLAGKRLPPLMETEGTPDSEFSLAQLLQEFGCSSNHRK